MLVMQVSNAQDIPLTFWIGLFASIYLTGLIIAQIISDKSLPLKKRLKYILLWPYYLVGGIINLIRWQ